VNNFGAIGLQVDDPGELARLIDGFGAFDLREELRHRSGRHLRWTDSSGASLALHLEWGRCTCMTPFFEPVEGLARWEVASGGARDDAVCKHCGGADCDVVDDVGEVVTRATVQFLHYAPYRSWLGTRRRYELEAVAFARRLEVFPDEAALSRAEPAGLSSMRLAAKAFLPMGMFAATRNVTEAATALFTGLVERAEARRNTRGAPFWRLRVATLPGAVDVVAARDSLGEAPAVGSIALVEAWLVGRPASPPPRSSIWRFFARKA
jgi:hypothetical protein